MCFWHDRLCLLSGVSTPAREKEAPGGLLFTAAEQGDARKEMCHHSERANPAGTTSGGNKVGSESEYLAPAFNVDALFLFQSSAKCVTADRIGVKDKWINVFCQRPLTDSSAAAIKAI